MYLVNAFASKNSIYHIYVIDVLKARLIHLFLRPPSFFEPQAIPKSLIISPMNQIPTLTQVLNQAINNRLLDLHTALIARFESYDPAKHQVSVSPVLKRAVPTLDGHVAEEQLPILSEVPVLFPRAGGFFISFPIQPGDFVQLIFNESSIDAWLTGASSSMALDERFTLQGAVALPGVYPEAKAFISAHKTNFVAGKDNGVQLHIDGDKIKLGSDKASEALAIASKVKQELEKIQSAFNSHSHKGSCANGAVTTAPIMNQLGPISPIGTSKVVAE
jgi:hypothetical protein